MQFIIQRVISAKVTVDDQVISEIPNGFLVYVGFHKTDTEQIVLKGVKKLKSMRLADDKPIPSNQHFLFVSNFTLYSKFKGNKLDFHNAMKRESSESMFNYFVEEMKKLHANVSTGKFGSYSMVYSVVDGPRNILVEFVNKLSNE